MWIGSWDWEQVIETWSKNIDQITKTKGPEDNSLERMKNA